jgi:hypothetical protein
MLNVTTILSPYQLISTMQMKKKKKDKGNHKKDKKGSSASIIN